MTANPLGQFFVDVNGSNSCEPLDVLELINQINRTASGSGEGELRFSRGFEPWTWGAVVASIRLGLEDEDRDIGPDSFASRLDQAFSKFTDDWFS